jgi:hypothetical protein
VTRPYLGARRRPHPHAEAWSLVRRAGVDDYGDPLPAVSTALLNVVVAPAGGDEADGRGDQVTHRLDLYVDLDQGENVRPTDRLVRHDGTEWNIDGPPQVWRSPVSGRGGVVIRAERVTG